MDVISSLPDDIIHRILSFLPTKYAVATSILSTRWKFLWTSVPILDFDAMPREDLYSVLNMNANRRSEIIFQNFVSRVLLLNDMPCIRKFRLLYGCLSISAPIRTWFHVAISRNVQELELDFCLSAHRELVELPRMLFTSSMLVVLKLSRMPLKVPSVVSLPSLRVLELRRIMYLSDDCIQNLLSGCQALEELTIEEIAREKPRVVDISIQTLKSFYFGYRYVIDVMVDCLYKFIIDAPNLEFFHLKGRITDVIEVRNLSGLNTALLDLSKTAISTEVYSICRQRTLLLLKGVSKVNSITLSGDIIELLSETLDQSLPRFFNLTHLAFGIGFEFSWKRILTEFIKCSPYLEVFTLNNKQGFLRDLEELRDIPIQPLPDNLLYHLKKILIDDLYANFTPEYVEQLVQHVNVLKRLKTNCRCPIMLRRQIDLTA